jgi:hypothetical protein
VSRGLLHVMAAGVIGSRSCSLGPLVFFAAGMRCAHLPLPVTGIRPSPLQAEAPISRAGEPACFARPRAYRTQTGENPRSEPTNAAIDANDEGPNDGAR